MSTDLSIYITELEEIFTSLDREYKAGQEHYGDFSCNGCLDNCCTTVFRHQTLVEYFYLCEGLDALDPHALNVITMRSEMYFREIAKKPFDLPSLKIMCPLNFNDKCVVYTHRPLICRAHGMPSVLHTPGKEKQETQGCKVFQERHQAPYDLIMDRTLWYTRIADLEARLRSELVFLQRYRKTIAEMVLDFVAGEIRV